MHYQLPHNSPPDRPTRDQAATASALDRAADAALFFGRASAAERLSVKAAELRDTLVSGGRV